MCEGIERREESRGKRAEADMTERRESRGGKGSDSTCEVDSATQ